MRALRETMLFRVFQFSRFRDYAFDFLTLDTLASGL
jgi:hypothetical protein